MYKIIDKLLGVVTFLFVCLLRRHERRRGKGREGFVKLEFSNPFLLVLSIGVTHFVRSKPPNLFLQSRVLSPILRVRLLPPAPVILYPGVSVVYHYSRRYTPSLNHYISRYLIYSFIWFLLSSVLKVTVSSFNVCVLFLFWSYTRQHNLTLTSMIIFQSKNLRINLKHIYLYT